MKVYWASKDVTKDMPMGMNHLREVMRAKCKRASTLSRETMMAEILEGIKLKGRSEV